jgi:hypothetical protein
MSDSLLRGAVLSILGLFPTSILAQNMAPELFLEGKNCDEIVVWAAQPADVLKQELDEILGADMARIMKGSMGRDIVAAARSQPVSDQWFAGQCDFSEEQLANMAPLQEGYVLYLDAMRSE